jgi:hypothetical protein
LARAGSEHLFTGPEPACGISIGVANKAVKDRTNRNYTKKTLRIRNCTETGQKNEGFVEVKQRSINMGGMTTYRTLSPKRTPFQIGFDR